MPSRYQKYLICDEGNNVLGVVSSMSKDRAYKASTETYGPGIFLIKIDHHTMRKLQNPKVIEKSDK